MSFFEQEATVFENQYGVVTGGSAGIGYQVVKYLLDRGVKKIAVLDKAVAQDSCRRLISDYGRDRVLLIRCDVSVQADLEAAYRTIMEDFPKLDILVNNAGILDDLAWEKEIAVNLNGTIRSTLLATKYMSKNEGGSGGTIINTSSLSGVHPSAGCPIYAAASSAIITFTNALAKPFHYSLTGIRMMNICPGVTYTRIISGASKKMLSDDIGKEWLKELSMLTTQKPECVAAGVIHMLIHGKNGSTWISEGGKSIFELDSPQVSSATTTIQSTGVRTL